MENVVKYFNTIESSFRKTKIVVLSAVAMAAAIAIGSLVYAASYISSHSDNIYVLDRGEAYSATVMDAQMVDRGIEAEDHVKRFHEYMFNLSPSRDVIQRNIETALHMCDGTAYDYYSDQQEKGYYSRLIQTNTTQYITVDSVSVNMGLYPYPERTFGKVYILRESNITSYQFESQGQLVEVGRSKNNPHGLMLEQFVVTKYDRIETKRRN